MLVRASVRRPDGRHPDLRVPMTLCSGEGEGWRGPDFRGERGEVGDTVSADAGTLSADGYFFADGYPVSADAGTLSADGYFFADGYCFRGRR